MLIQYLSNTERTPSFTSFGAVYETTGRPYNSKTTQKSLCHPSKPFRSYRQNKCTWGASTGFLVNVGLWCHWFCHHQTFVGGSMMLWVASQRKVTKLSVPQSRICQTMSRIWSREEGMSCIPDLGLIEPFFTLPDFSTNVPPFIFVFSAPGCRSFIRPPWRAPLWASSPRQKPSCHAGGVTLHPFLLCVPRKP